jgi:hypothetical protein
VTEIRAQADQALIAGDYLQAQQLLEQLQVLLPEDPETAAALSQIQEVSQLTTLYGEAKAAMGSNDWEHAATALTQLQVLDSEYRDVSDLLKIVEKARPLEAQFQVAETAFANGQWSAAIEQYQTLRQQDLTFRANDIQAHLFESYLAHGRAIIDQTDTDPEAVTAAIVQFTEALKLSPVDATVLTERRLAEDYLLSLDASSIDERIALLQSIYEQQPDYANGTVTQRLYDNLVDRAGQSLATNNEDAAIADYQLAAQLPVEDATEAQQSLADLTD